MWKEKATQKIYRLRQINSLAALVSIVLMVSLCTASTGNWTGLTSVCLALAVITTFITRSISKDMAREEELLLLTPPVSVKDLKRAREIISNIQSERPRLEKQIADTKLSLANKINSLAYSPNKETRILAQDIPAFEVDKYTNMYQNVLDQIKTKAEQAIREVFEVFDIMPPNLEIHEIQEIEVSPNQIVIETMDKKFEIPIIASASPQSQSVIETLNFLSILFVEVVGPPLTELDKIDKLDGTEFEQYIIKVLNQHGYSASLSGGSGDLGVDILAEKNEIKYAIQCKRQGSMVSRRAVSDAVAGMQHYNCDQAVVITNNIFSPGAKQLAKSNDCILIDRNTLRKIVNIKSEKSQDILAVQA